MTKFRQEPWWPSRVLKIHSKKVRGKTLCLIEVFYIGFGNGGNEKNSRGVVKYPQNIMKSNHCDLDVEAAFVDAMRNPIFQGNKPNSWRAAIKEAQLPFTEKKKKK